MGNRILLTSTALAVAMGAAAPAQKGRAAQPEVRQVPMPRQQ